MTSLQTSKARGHLQKESVMCTCVQLLAFIRHCYTCRYVNACTIDGGYQASSLLIRKKLDLVLTALLQTMLTHTSMSQQVQHSSNACSGEHHQCCLPESLSSAVHAYTCNMHCNCWSDSNRTVLLIGDETSLLGQVPGYMLWN